MLNNLQIMLLRMTRKQRALWGLLLLPRLILVPLVYLSLFLLCFFLGLMHGPKAAIETWKRII